MDWLTTEFHSINLTPSSARRLRHQLPRETVANSTGAGCVLKSQCCCNRAHLRPRHSPHSAWRTPLCCQERPILNPDIPARKPQPWPNPEMDPLPHPPPCAPIVRPERYPPSARTSTGYH